LPAAAYGTTRVTPKRKRVFKPETTKSLIAMLED